MLNTEIRSLTGLRGIAACWVVLFHMGPDGGLGALLGTLGRHGYLAVDLFFVLSGFVMALSYRALFARGLTGRGYATFLLRRVARVWPLYVVATLGYAAVLAAGFGSNRLSAGTVAHLLPVNLAMLQAWGFGESIDHPAWSISTEFAAYLLFPVFAWMTLFGRPAVAVGASVAAFLALCTLPTLAGHGGLSGPLDLSAAGTVWPLLRCLLEFPLGMAAYRLATGLQPSSVLLRPVAAWGLAALLLLLLCVVDTDLAVVGLAPLFLVQLALCRNGVTRVLGSAPVLFLGRVSYAVYLLHWTLLPTVRFGRVLEPALSHTAAVVAMQLLAFAVLIPAAAVAFHLVEMPGRRLVNQLGRWVLPFQEVAVKRSEAAGAAELPLPRAS